MPKAETASLQTVQDQLQAILEEKVTDLMTQIKASQAVSRQIARTGEEIERQRLLRERLETELGPLRKEVAELTIETKALQDELAGVASAAARLREIRNELTALRTST
jgi:hypothetical protein